MAGDRALQEWQRRLRALSLILDHFASGELTHRTDASILEELCESELAARAAYHARHTSKRRASGGRTAASKTSSAPKGSPAKSSPVRRPSTAKSSSAGRRAGNTIADQALELIRSRPGITIPQIAMQMGIEPNHLYRVLPKLQQEGAIKRKGQGWQPASTAKASPGDNLQREPLREGFPRPELMPNPLAKEPGSPEIDWLVAEFRRRTAVLNPGGSTGSPGFPGSPSPAGSIDISLVLADMKPLIDTIPDPDVQQRYEKVIVPALRRQPEAPGLLLDLKHSLDRQAARVKDSLDPKMVWSTVAATEISGAINHLVHFMPH